MLDLQQHCRYEDKFFERLCERLDDVMAMRDTHAELLELLGTNSLDHVVSFCRPTLAALPLLNSLPSSCVAVCEAGPHKHSIVCRFRLLLKYLSHFMTSAPFTSVIMPTQLGMLPKPHLKREWCQ